MTLHSGVRGGHAGNGGFSLLTVLTVMFVVSALAVAAAIIGSSHLLANRYYSRHAQLEASSRAGVEWARAQLNADRSLFPDSSYVVIEDGVEVNDGGGTPAEGLQRWTYAGPSGNITGQYGVFGSVVSVTRDLGGGVAILRSQVAQESFAKYAYFTDIEPSNISFGGGDQIFGPVHTNDNLKIYSSGATFHDETHTAKTVVGASYGTFDKGYEEGVAPIAMPETSELNKLRSLATTGNMAFTELQPTGQGEATIRIEFMAIDLDGDGSPGENEGFIRVYRSTDEDWVTGDVPSGGMRSSENCGHYESDGTFVSAADHPGGRGGGSGDNWSASLSSSTRRCHLGGSDSIFGAFRSSDSHGSWVPYPGTPSPLVAGRDDAGYLFPLSRDLNPNFKGVIFVDGSVAISGVLRGRVTVAATDQIIFADDLTYSLDPSTGTCRDILGIFSGNDIVVADNTLNAPIQPSSGGSYYTYDDTKDEFIHGIVLALDIFTVENYASGSRLDEACEAKNWGRGCLYLTGGIIQRTRGAVGTIQSSGGTGYVKRYAYDKCGATAPPPYFPTTGHFNRAGLYPVDPADFDIDTYIEIISSGG
jgi:hypothetical protein